MLQCQIGISKSINLKSFFSKYNFKTLTTSSSSSTIIIFLFLFSLNPLLGSSVQYIVYIEKKLSKPADYPITLCIISIVQQFMGFKDKTFRKSLQALIRLTDGWMIGQVFVCFLSRFFNHRFQYQPVFTSLDRYRIVLIWTRD